MIAPQNDWMALMETREDIREDTVMNRRKNNKIN